MALTTTYTATRDQIITRSLRMLGVIAQGESPTASQSSEADEALKAILKELNAFSFCRWTVTNASLTLTSATILYTAGAGVSNIATNIHRLVDAWYVDASGYSLPVEIIDNVRYAGIYDKNIAGAIAQIYLKDSKDLASKTLYVNPRPTTVTTEKLYYDYEASVRVCGVAADVLDIPMEWQRYIILRLAADMAHEYSVPLQQIQLLENSANSSLNLLNLDQMHTFEKIKLSRKQTEQQGR